MSDLISIAVIVVIFGYVLPPWCGIAIFALFVISAWHDDAMNDGGNLFVDKKR